MSKQQKNSAFVKMLKEFPKVFGRVSFRERLMLRTAFDYINEEVIANIKANCDFAIEGRDVKIMELTKQIEKMRKKDELKKVASVWNYLRTVGAETRIAELEKENAELKGLKDVATLIRANNDTVVTLMQLNNKLVSKNQQLTKAIELLNEFMRISKASDEDFEHDYSELIGETEQFMEKVK